MKVYILQTVYGCADTVREDIRGMYDCDLIEFMLAPGKAFSTFEKAAAAAQKEYNKEFETVIEDWRDDYPGEPDPKPQALGWEPCKVDDVEYFVAGPTEAITMHFQITELEVK